MSKLNVQFFSKDFLRDFSDGRAVKNPPANAGDARLGYDPWVREDPLEKEMAIHVSIFALKISWTEEPGSIIARDLDMT